MKKEEAKVKEQVSEETKKSSKASKTNKTNKENTNKDNDESKAKNDKSVNEKKKEESQHTESEQTLSKEEQLQLEVEQQKDKYLRLFAEFENYKRRTSKERLELFKTASQELMQAMLPVLDDFDRALKEINKSKDKNLIEGVELINNKLRETLKSKGLEPMLVKEGDTFDGDIHEAVTQIPAPDKSMKGKIVDVVEKGYTLGEKIIRFPKVVTGK